MPVIDLTATASKRARHALKTIAGLIERDTEFYLTAKDWGMLLNELVENANFAVDTPIARASWRQSIDAAGHMEMGGTPQADGGRTPVLKIINSGSDDMAYVNRKNRETPGAIDFQQKRERLQTGKPSDETIKGWLEDAKSSTTLSRPPSLIL